MELINSRGQTKQTIRPEGINKRRKPENRNRFKARVTRDQTERENAQYATEWQYVTMSQSEREAFKQTD